MASLSTTCVHRKGMDMNDYNSEVIYEVGDLPAILVPEDVAAFLNIHLNTVYKLLNTGVLKGFRAGVHWRIYKENLLQYILGRP